MVECDLAKVEVAGSNPVSRSNVFYRLSVNRVTLQPADACLFWDKFIDVCSVLVTKKSFPPAIGTACPPAEFDLKINSVV